MTKVCSFLQLFLFPCHLFSFFVRFDSCLTNKGYGWCVQGVLLLTALKYFFVRYDGFLATFNNLKWRIETWQRNYPFYSQNYSYWGVWKSRITQKNMFFLVVVRDTKLSVSKAKCASERLPAHLAFETESFVSLPTT